jgi:hypothetical protein
VIGRDRFDTSALRLLVKFQGPATVVVAGDPPQDLYIWVQPCGHRNVGQKHVRASRSSGTGAAVSAGVDMTMFPLCSPRVKPSALGEVSNKSGISITTIGARQTVDRCRQKIVPDRLVAQSGDEGAMGLAVRV